MHAGGIVEYSTDAGASWLNVGSCSEIETENLYTSTDTLVTGQPSFMGNSNGELLSRIEIINCIGEKTTTTSCMPFYDGFNIIYFRFRFVSDSTVDTLSGWMIDSIRIETLGCGPGYVPQITQQNIISIFPNPACNDLTITGTDLINQITITNLFGQVASTGQYNAKEVHIDVADLPAGIYFVKVNGSDVRKFVKE